jgi:hypothetical protein
MAVNLTPSFVSSGGGPEFIRSPRGMELVKLTGIATAAGDTSTAYTCRNIKAPAYVVGAAIGAVSGATVTFTSLVALGSNDMYVWVYEAI